MDFPHAGDCVGFFRRFVRPEPDDSGEAQGIAAVVPVRFHNVVEGHFEHDLGFDLQAESLIFNCVLEEPLGHLGNLGISQTGISLPHIQ